MTNISIKPYMIRAIYEWCADAGYTPCIAVKVNAATRVPAGHVKNGEIVLNISHSATRNLTIGNEVIQFSARFGGISQELSVPIETVVGVFARENGKGVFFEGDSSNDSVALPDELSATLTGESKPNTPPSPTKPHLTVVK